ncbi:hypothetical protein [Clavibacter michiganensis]|uniref:Uncharacterized protein n=1 Tax=Clavibacter michiganensis TaxID=28447 RepID=A0A251YMY2_9MICO|nr:hypothetical protein [Clavibacter michiganensis]OUE25519.1 hypothetical protein BFL37_05910 [Clavibacter michiganensis]
MDSGWAALLGAIIGAVATAGVPWLRDSLTEKRRREEKRHEDLADALAELIAIMAFRSAKAKLTPDELARSETAAARFTLLTTPEEKPVVDVMVTALFALSSDAKLTRVDAYIVFLDLISQWHQGALTADEVKTRYYEELPDADDARSGTPG